MNEEQSSVAMSENLSKRKLKKLFLKIRNQMEFYFSDSNLARDKFLLNLIEQDPDGYVDLTIFKTFNKIKVFTEDIDVIATAVSRSDMLQLSEDRKKVKRMSLVSLTKDFDACTIYVEKLPSYADQKWVKDVFEHFGPVDYVNVPQFKITNKVKGFAFVEFKNPESVKQACDFYKGCSERESASEDDAKEFKSSKRKLSDDIPDKRQRKNEAQGTSDDCTENKLSEEPDSSQNIQINSSFNPDEIKSHMQSTPSNKRKLKDDEETASSKKIKSSEVEIAENVESNTSMKINDEPIPKNEASSLEKISDDSENISNNCDASKSKRKRKNSKKSRSDRPVLRVMSKSEWKSYRNKYLDVQRCTMSYLKRTVMLQTQILKEQDVLSKSMDTASEGPKKGLQFQPGLIIKIKLNEPVKHSSDIKDQVKANAIVAYVDAPVDETDIYVRCHTAEDALSIISEGKCNHFGHVELLEGTEESKYWDKIESDRSFKLNNPVIRKKRGRDKIIAKAAKIEEMKNKHIYFDE